MENLKRLKSAASQKDINEVVKEFKDKKANEPKTFWFYIKALHAIDEMKDWLTLESMPLMPFVEKNEKNYIFHFLFATPSKDNTLNKPWGMASISMPDMRVLKKVAFNKTTIEQIPVLDIKMLCTNKFIEVVQKAFDENDKIPLPPKEILSVFDIILNNSGKKAEQFGGLENKNPNWPSFLEFMDNFTKVLRDDGQDNLLNQMRKIKKRIESPIFSVAVVGEFNRGKSTLINNLLGEELLPVGDLPTTAMLTKITYGENKKVLRFFEGKNVELSLDEWRNLVADENGNDPEGVLLAITDNDFLNKTGIQIIDTPGAGDVFGKRAAITIESIASCDATIVTVSATMPLSLTEKSFVEDNIFLKKIPKVSVVVTHIDQISENERFKVYEHIKREVDKWGKDIPVWVSGNEVDKFNKNIISGHARIKDELIKWSMNSDNELLRYNQACFQAKNIIDIYLKVLNEKKEMFQLEKEQIAEKLKKEREIELRKDLIWEDILIEIEKRELDFTRWMTSVIEEKKPEIKEDILLGLKNFPDPKKWWDENFPVILKRKMMGLVKEFDLAIKRKVSSDSELFSNFAKQKLNWDYKVSNGSIPFENISLNNSSENIEINGGSLDKYRTGSRFVSGLAFMGAAALFPGMPVGMLIAAGAGLIVEKVIKGKIDRQRSQVERHAEDVLNMLFDHMVEETGKSISKIYLSVAKDILNQKNIWKENMLKSYETSDKNDVSSQVFKVDNQIKRIIELNKI